MFMLVGAMRILLALVGVGFLAGCTTWGPYIPTNPAMYSARESACRERGSIVFSSHAGVPPFWHGAQHAADRAYETCIQAGDK